MLDLEIKKVLLMADEDSDDIDGGLEETEGEDESLEKLAEEEDAEESTDTNY